MTFDEIRAYITAISEAFRAFVNTPVPQKWAILEHQQHLLLTDEADKLATALVEENRKSNNPDERQMADYIEAHRNMLRRCREPGIAVIRAKFEASSKANEQLPHDSDLESILLALIAFDKAPFSQKRQILEQEQHHLLTDATDQLLTNMIREAEQSDNAEESRAINQLKTTRDLLRQARKIGIAATWEELETRKNMFLRIEQEPKLSETRDTIFALSMASMQDAQEILESNQHLLLTDTAEQLLNFFIQEAQQNDDSDFASQLTATRMLISRVREIGINAAIHEIKEVDVSLLIGIAPADLLPILSAVQEFVSAYEPQEIQSVFECHQTILLSDIAERVLRQFIKNVKQRKDNQQWIEHLERYLVLLHTIQNSGIDATLSIMDTVNHYAQIDQKNLPDGESTNLLAIFRQWSSIPVYREQRRFLEAHPELLDIRFDALLQITLELDKTQEQALREQQKEMSSDDAQIMQMIRNCIALLRDIRARGGTIQAIREGYVNLHTGFALDLPDWLEPIEEQWQVLIKRDEPAELSPETALLLANLLRPAVHRADSDATIAPEIRAGLYVRFGNAFTGLDSINHREELEEAIHYLEKALPIYTQERYLYCWTMIQQCLGMAYFNRIHSDRQDNLERSRIAFEATLQLYTRDINPRDWADIHKHLGTIYRERDLGDPYENSDRALSYYNAALEVFTRQTYPLKWAHLQFDLSELYRKRRWMKKEHRQIAIGYLRKALEIFTREQFPLEWAETQHRLNLILTRKVLNDEPDPYNIEQSIAIEQAILEICTREQFPQRWANTQNTLGTLYADRKEGNPEENLQLALAHFKATLQIYTREAFPLDFQHIHLNIAQMAHWKIADRALEKGDQQAVHNAYTLAHHHYALARDVQAELGWLTANPQTRAILQGSVNEMYMRDAWCLLQTGDLRGAIVALEAGRAQALAETQAIANAQLDKVCSLHREYFIAARQRLQSTLISEDRLAIRSARDAFLEVRKNIGDCCDCYPDFLPDEPSYQEIADAAAPNQALVYLAAMDRGGVALVVPPAQGQTDGNKREPFAITLPYLTWETSIAWLEKTDGKGKLGGFRFGLESNGVKLIAHWLSQAESEEERAQWLTVTFQNLPQALPSSMPTLRSAVEKMLRSWQVEANRLSSDITQQQKVQDIRKRLITPLSQADALAPILTNDLGWFVLETELEQVLQNISEEFARELRQQLDQHGLHNPEQPIALIPCGRLGALPIHAASVRNDPQTGEAVPFLDTCELSYQASARSLATARSILNKLPLNGPVLAVGNPQAAGLIYSEAEAIGIAATARRLGRKASQCMVGREATIENVENTLLLFRQHHPGAWLHIASHGHADSVDPTNCYMLLSNRQKLTLADLQRKRLLEGLRGFNASGCVTGLGDIQTAPDELSSFAAGILQAGAPCALATLWSVNDHANYLLMLRYMQEMLQSPTSSPTRALRKAVWWLRHATHRDVQRLEESRSRDMQSFDSEGDMTREALRGSTIQDSDATQEDNDLKEAFVPREPLQARQDETQVTFPYSHPVYWAAAILYGV